MSQSPFTPEELDDLVAVFEEACREAEAEDCSQDPRLDRQPDIQGCAGRRARFGKTQIAGYAGLVTTATACRFS